MGKPVKMAYFSPLYEGTEKDTQSFGLWLRNLLLISIGNLGFVICITLLYHAMRGVMDLGGFVASGGPYQIAHQAPGWIWIFWVAIIGGLIFLFLYTPFARKIGGLKLTVMAWPVLFCSLGYNFFSYAIIPESKGGGFVIGWLICGILFVLMGGIPLIIIIKETFRYISQRGYRRQLRQEGAKYQRTSDELDKNYLPGGLISFSVLLVILGGIAGGIYLAILFFNKLTT